MFFESFLDADMEVINAPPRDLLQKLLRYFPNIKIACETIDYRSVVQDMIQPSPESSKSPKTTAVTIIGELEVPFSLLTSVRMKRPIALKVSKGGFFYRGKEYEKLTVDEKYEKLTVDEVVSPVSAFIILAKFAESE